MGGNGEWGAGKRFIEEDITQRRGGAKEEELSRRHRVHRGHGGKKEDYKLMISLVNPLSQFFDLFT
jgi:hypothetical protein